MPPAQRKHAGRYPAAMAIKGKKKAQSRGAARRRPAGAPRPTAVRREHTPWYRTSGGRVAVAIIAALVLSSIGGIIAALNSSSNRSEARREQLDEYTSVVRDFGQQMADPATQMAAITPETAGGALRDLAKQSSDWADQLVAARAEAAQTQPPASMREVNGLLSESLLLYTSAAETLRLAADAEGEMQSSLLLNALNQHERAGNIFLTTVALIDREREREGMEASGIGHPAQIGTLTPSPEPSPTNQQEEADEQ
jgi:hypothetical protein